MAEKAVDEEMSNVLSAQPGAEYHSTISARVLHNQSASAATERNAASSTHSFTAGINCRMCLVSNDMGEAPPPPTPFVGARCY